nr:MAG TPA: hypothetical protein [Caudoviricetes sp.]
MHLSLSHKTDIFGIYSPCGMIHTTEMSTGQNADMSRYTF